MKQRTNFFVSFLKISEIIKNLWKRWIFIAQFHFQEPDPDSEYGSSLAICIWIQPDPDPKH